MKIALITDTHWGVRNDSIAFIEYFEKFYNNVFFPEIEKRNIKTICHLGDIVDRRKYINYFTLRKMKEIFMDRCKSNNIDLHVLIGNHDVPFKNTNDVNSMNELFADANINYYSEPKIVEFDGTPILMMPWINNANYAESMITLKNAKTSIVFGHFEIAGCLMDKSNINEHGLSISDFDRYDIVCSGHFHHRSITKNIRYLGNPYELTWADYLDPRGFHIFDTETREFEFIKNPYSMFYKIYYNDEEKQFDDVMNHDFESYRNTYIKVIKQTCNNPYWFDQLIDELYKVEPIQIQIVDDSLNLNLENNDEIVNEAEDTITILSKYIDTLPENVPKKDLDKLMRSLYNEALYMEKDD
jgi:predicted phosphodiesterase